jgi:hypothetical protein
VNNDAHIEFKKTYEIEYLQIETEFNKKKPVEFIKFIAAHFKPKQWINEFKEEDYKP